MKLLTHSTSRALTSLVITLAIVFALIGLPVGVRAQTAPTLIALRSVEFTRPANTTAYTIGDAVTWVTKTITACSNATPIVCTSTANGYVLDDRVTIAGVGGNTNANGTFKVRVQTADTFSLWNESTGVAIAGNAAYTSGGTAQKLLRIADALAVPGGTGSIVGVRLVTDTATVTLGTFRLRAFNLPVTQQADNAAFTLLYANRAKEVFDVSLLILGTEGAGSDSSTVTTAFAQPMPFTCAANRIDLFVQVTALAAFVPTSGENFRLEFTIKRDLLRSPF
jgi:hypothetical protein